MLELQNISYGVEQDGDSKNILRDISLTIDERFVAYLKRLTISFTTGFTSLLRSMSSG